MAAVGNWVAEITTTVGVGPISLGGALTGFVRFSPAIPDGEVWYALIDGDNKEAGRGVLSGSTLNRTEVFTTLYNGIYDDSTPSPIPLSGTANVYSTFNKTAFEEFTNASSLLDGKIDTEIAKAIFASGGQNVMGQTLDMSTNLIKNLAQPVDDNDAVRLIDVSTLVGDDVLDAALRAEAAATAAETSETNTINLYDDFRQDYMGNGANFPVPLKDGSLFYYDGPSFTQGLYINYASNNEPGTLTWALVSGPGPAGPTGAEGIQGSSGLQGVQGEIGPQGIQGIQGLEGPLGVTGPQGIDGPQGIQGPTGIQGDQGLGGLTGPTGATGPVGPQGIQGDLGPDGPNGPQGVQGIQGPLGPEGPTGPQGATGQQGQSFSIDETGLFSERPPFDDEPKGFSFYATDFVITADSSPDADRIVSDGIETDYLLTFVPDGQQSLVVTIGGVLQAPDNYTVLVQTLPDRYTVQLNEAPDLDVDIIIREVTISTGFGALFIKLTNASADWSDPIPFGKGPQGNQGELGPEGPTGPTGQQGIVGPDGAVGPQGSQGVAGPQGSTGNTGPAGPQGATGDQGPTGTQGPQGDAGVDGDQGPIGNNGSTGPQGTQGETGTQGPQGDQGITGATGPQGAQGSVGPQGIAGNTGPTGPTGPIGAAGPDGEAGADGADGADGSVGDDGKSGSRTRLYDSGIAISWSVGRALLQFGGESEVVDGDVSVQYYEVVLNMGTSDSRIYEESSGLPPSNTGAWRRIAFVTQGLISELNGVGIRGTA